MTNTGFARITYVQVEYYIYSLSLHYMPIRGKQSDKKNKNKGDSFENKTKIVIDLWVTFIFFIFIYLSFVSGAIC